MEPEKFNFSERLGHRGDWAANFFIKAIVNKESNVSLDGLNSFAKDGYFVFDEEAKTYTPTAKFLSAVMPYAL